MSVWDVYENRMDVHGITKREAAKKREVRMIQSKLPDSLSYTQIRVFDHEHNWNITDSEMVEGSYTQNVSIINSDSKFNEKTIISMPGEDIEHGCLIEWMGSYWIVVNKDFNTTLYTKAKLLQCNYLLKWVSEDNSIIKQWCVVDDGSESSSGEHEYGNYVVTKGDSRIIITIPKNSQTGSLNRESRFLVDDSTSDVPLAYQLTKPLKVGSTYNDYGIYKYVLQEVTCTINDNYDLMIADYYKHFPNSSNTLSDSMTTTERTVWI